MEDRRASKEAIQGMIANPENREEAIVKLLEAYGGKLLSYYLSLNEDIGYFIVSEISDDKIEDLLESNP